MSRNITRYNILLYLMIPLAMLCIGNSCNSYETPEDMQCPLVVEGLIEDGGFPVVYLTRSLSFSTEYQDLDISSLIEQWAHVSITDLTSGQQVIMTGVLDMKKTPPYRYVNYDMKGQTGHTYRLDISCTDGSRATATTTIPHSTRLDSIAVVPIHGIDSTRLLTAYIHPTDTLCHYMFYVRDMLRQHSSWLPAYASLAESLTLPANGATTVNNTHHNTDRENSQTYFVQNQEIGIKLYTLSDEAWDFWLNYANMGSLNIGMVFPSSSLPGNVNGALGYFFGYGMDQHIVHVK